ncbi:C39 family peptidase [Effusibacillus pohliae]|uniref:C39 family peptidase n=1 Tax=Effusibacillus pohliae TaxID=232270 RepID=UPI0009FFBF9B
MNNGEPIIALITWKGGSGTGHVFVIRGYYQDTSVPKSDVYYIDPLDASYNIKAL